MSPSQPITTEGGSRAATVDHNSLATPRFGAHEGDRMISRRETAAFLNVSVSTLERWHASGIGPECTKIGPRKVGYRVRDLITVGA